MYGEQQSVKSVRVQKFLSLREGVGVGERVCGPTDRSGTVGEGVDILLLCLVLQVMKLYAYLLLDRGRAVRWPSVVSRRPRQLYLTLVWL